jgi:electron transport complex protein RnfG
VSTKELIKVVINLAVIYLAGGVLLAAVYAKTSPIIYQKNEDEKKLALKKMMPDADENGIKKIGDWHPHEKHAEYFAAKKGDTTLGYIVQTFGKGYSSYINILFSVDDSFKVQNIQILHHAETPGLGDEIETDWFKKQFAGKDENHLKVLKQETAEYIQAITGATISSRAVTEDGVREGLKFLKTALKDGGSAHGAGEETSKPEVAKPATPESEVSRPATPKSEISKSDAPKPQAPKSDAPKPEIPKGEQAHGTQP